MDQALLDQAGGASQQVADAGQETATPPPSGRSSVVELDSNQEEVVQGLELLSTDLNELLETEAWSNITIKYGPSEFKAHRGILAVRSPVMKKMLEEDNEITIKEDMLSDTVEIMLDYIYTSKLPRVMEYVQLEDLIGAADFYALLELKAICFNHITKELTLDNIGDLVRLAHLYSAPEPVKEKLIGFSHANFYALRNPSFKQVWKDCLDFFIPG